MPDPLGSWSIDIHANQKPVIQELEQVRQQLIKGDTAAKNVTQSFHTLGGSSRGAAQGILALSQAVDDAQYGFRAIVNNIPQIVYMLGGSAGLAGAVGITAVAVNQLINHWDELDHMFARTQGMETAKGLLVELKEELDRLGKSSPGMIGTIMRWWNDPKWKDAADATKRHVESLKEVAEATKKISDIKSKDDTERGGAFKEAIERAGGGEAIARQMADRAMAGRTFATRKEHDDARQQAVDQAFRQLGQGVEGGRVPMQGFPDKLRGAVIDVETEISAKRTAKQLKERDDEERSLERSNEKRQKAERTARIEALQDQEKSIQRQKHQMAESEWERTHGAPRTSQILQGARAAIDLYQTSGPNTQKEMMTKAHRLQEEANKKLEKIKDAIEKERRKGVILAT